MEDRKNEREIGNAVLKEEEKEKKSEGTGP